MIHQGARNSCRLASGRKGVTNGERESLEGRGCQAMPCPTGGHSRPVRLSAPPRRRVGLRGTDPASPSSARMPPVLPTARLPGRRWQHATTPTNVSPDALEAPASRDGLAARPWSPLPVQRHSAMHPRHPRPGGKRGQQQAWVGAARNGFSYLVGCVVMLPILEPADRLKARKLRSDRV